MKFKHCYIMHKRKFSTISLSHPQQEHLILNW